MNFLQISELKFYEKDEEGDFKIETFDSWYNNTILTNWLNKEDVERLIEFLQKQIENR